MFPRIVASSRQFFRRETSGQISLFDRTGLVFLLITIAWYLIAYFHSPLTPNDPKNDDQTWLRGADQIQYLKSAIEFSHGELKSNMYWFGYPILGAPFYPFLPRHAFLIPDLLLAVVMISAFFASCRHLVSRGEAWLLVAVAVYFGSVLRDRCLIVPLNTMPAYAAIYLVAYLLVFARPTLRHFAVAAGAIGFALLARPNELVALGPLYLIPALLWRDPGKWRALAFFGATVAGAATMLISLDYYFFHTLLSPYAINERYKFGYAHMGVKIYQLLCDGTFLTGDSTLPVGTRPHQLLERFPYFLLIIPGLLALVRTRGPVVLALYAAILFTVLFYVTYNWASNPAFTWNCGSFHYYWWIVPWLTFFTYLSFRLAPGVVSRPVYFAALLVPVLVFAVVGFKTVEVAATDGTDPALALTTTYQDRIFHATLTARRDIGMMEDLRIYFATPPDDQGSTIAASDKLRIKHNGGYNLGCPGDYAVSEQGTGPYDLSFLFRDIRIRAGDTMAITCRDTGPPVIQRICFLRVKFAPGAALRRLLTP